MDRGDNNFPTTFAELHGVCSIGCDIQYFICPSFEPQSGQSVSEVGRVFIVWPDGRPG